MSLLSTVGELLYGPSWQTALGRALKKSDRTVRYWAADPTKIPAAAWQDIKEVARSRRAECGKAVALIKLYQETSE